MKYTYKKTKTKTLYLQGVPNYTTVYIKKYFETMPDETCKKDSKFNLENTLDIYYKQKYKHIKDSIEQVVKIFIDMT